MGSAPSVTQMGESESPLVLEPPLAPADMGLLDTISMPLPSAEAEEWRWRSDITNDDCLFLLFIFNYVAL